MIQTEDNDQLIPLTLLIFKLCSVCLSCSIMIMIINTNNIVFCWSKVKALPMQWSQNGQWSFMFENVAMCHLTSLNNFFHDILFTMECLNIVFTIENCQVEVQTHWTRLSTKLKLDKESCVCLFSYILASNHACKQTSRPSILNIFWHHKQVNRIAILPPAPASSKSKTSFTARIQYSVFVLYLSVNTHQV